MKPTINENAEPERLEQIVVANVYLLCCRIPKFLSIAFINISSVP